jgi:hypothetical protein
MMMTVSMHSVTNHACRYVTGKVHILYNSPLFVTHWVWTGGSPECKIQNLRDAMK